MKPLYIKYMRVKYYGQQRSIKMTLINQTHLNVVGLGNNFLSKMTKRMRTHYLTVPRYHHTHNKWTMCLCNLRHINIDEAIAVTSEPEEKEKLLKLKELLKQHNGVIPETSDAYRLEFGDDEITKFNYKAKQRRLVERAKRKKEFLLKWEAMKDKLWK